MCPKKVLISAKSKNQKGLNFTSARLSWLINSMLLVLCLKFQMLDLCDIAKEIRTHLNNFQEYNLLTANKICGGFSTEYTITT